VTTSPLIRTCPSCGSELGATLLSCPACHQLVYAEKLKEIAAEAEAAAAAGRQTDALAAWRRALELLPPDSRQSQAISERVAVLSRGLDGSPLQPPGPAPGSRPARFLAPLGVLGLMLWKFKFLVVFALTKAKLLLLGLTKASTFFSMLLSFGVYWSVWGWRFALGFIAAMYVHEMGHVAALHRLGIRASAPMFVPGFGAFVRLDQYPQSAREDARVGLAGPLWGLGAALVAFAIHLATGAPIWAAIARTAAFLNLFNLLPVWQLDGGRGYRALSRAQRGWIAGLILVMWVATHEGMLVLLLLVAGARLFGKDAPVEGDGPAFAQFAALIVTLAALSAVPVPGHRLP